MSKRRNNTGSRKTSKDQRRQRRVSHPTHLDAHLSRLHGELDEPGLLDHIRDASASDHPLPVLQLASALLATTDPRSANPFEPKDPQAPSQADFIELIMGSGVDEAGPLLAASSTLISDELLSARIRRSLSATHPTSLQQRYAAPEPYRAVEMSHLLGDGDNIFIGARNRDGDEFTFLVYIDHNLGTLVKDAFSVSEPVESLVRRLRRKSPGSEYTLAELTAADARAKVEDAIELASITYPPLETETWPADRFLLEAVVRQAPTGGSGYQRPEYSEQQLTAVSDDFFGSDYGRTLADAGHRFLLEAMLWFGTDYGPGDPLRWSPPSVEILLVDWFPRKLIAPAEDLVLLPELLRAFVRYCHSQRGIPEQLTEETLQAVDRFAPEYDHLIRTERRQGPEALLETVGAIPPLEGGDSGFDGVSIGEIMLNGIREQVGGAEQLERLDDDPLPDEDFDWAGIPVDTHQRVREVLNLCDRCCADVLDDGASEEPGLHEHRTAARRLLARVAAGDPAIFRRKGAANTAAGAICWIIAKANDRLHAHVGGLSAKDLLSHFGLKGGVSQRAEVMLRAAGINHRQYGGMRLGTPALLTSTARRDLIEMRDKYQAEDA